MTFKSLIQSAIERRRHLRGAHMALTFLFFLARQSERRAERRRHMRSAQMAPTFKNDGILEMSIVARFLQSKS